MSEFKIIETQEQLDKVISERLERQESTLEKKYKEKYADYEQIKLENADLKIKVENAEKAKAENDTTLSELQAKVQKYESDSVKTRIAREFNLPYEFVDRLKGDDEETIKKDAESLSKIISANKKFEVPLKSTEEEIGSGTESALKKTLNKLKGEE
ncbi:capsid assembly scaffolding protein Gp46 family protein [Anaerofustis stercorihominis]|uniref:DUF4355 domain-containing protein n=1 Tax=Anaerofustis stercorihominis TaxID=214853 RepID=A0A3E3DV05_9FIRM|nr:DUF4355 domain-containing protein [Anaerofustis stercorihominis]RGD72916.1 DUF4355 domain-containing protein [Anaerofustis stercorihominis]